MRTMTATMDVEFGEPDELSITRLFDLALDLLCVAGTDGYFKRVNDAFERVLGYSKEELLAIPFVDFVHPEDVDATLDAIRTLEDGEVVNDFENRFRTKSGEWRWLVWRSTPSDDGRYIYACARDITEREAHARRRRRAGRDRRPPEQGPRTCRTRAPDHDTGGRRRRHHGRRAASGRRPDRQADCAVQRRVQGAALRAPGAGVSSPSDWTIETAGAAGASAARHRSTRRARPPCCRPMPELGVNVRHLIGRVVARGEDIGYLLIAEVGTMLSSFDAQVVEHSSTVLSLELVSSRRAAGSREPGPRGLPRRPAPGRP